MKTQRFFYLIGILGVIGVVVLVFGGIISSSRDYLRDDIDTALTQVVIDDGWLTAVSEQITAVEYNISVTDDATTQQIAYQAPNREQNLRTYFSETGIQLEPRIIQGNAWNAGLEIVGLGDGVNTVVPTSPTYSAIDNQVTMDYGMWQAWYVNDARGIEQGFTVDEPLFVSETGMLYVDMAVTGDLVAQWVNDDAVNLVTAVGEQVLTYQNLVSFDAQGRDLPSRMEVVALPTGQSGIRLSVDVAQAEYPIVIDPLLSVAASWEAWIAQDADFGFSVSTAGDVNKDGFDDVLVGAKGFDSTHQNAGAVFAYYGSATGLSLASQWMVTGNVADMALGYAVNSAGDVNKDGFGDVIVGTNMAGIGKARVYLGSATGLKSAAVWEGSGEKSGDGFGTAVNTAGDVNKDGYDDVIIGAPYYDGDAGTNAGRAYVFHGPLTASTQSPNWIGEGGEVDYYSDGLFGYSVSTAGDVNQDGYKDIIIGEPLGRSEVIQGRVVIFTGSASGLFMPVNGGPAGIYDADWLSDGSMDGNTQYGASVSVAGDVNGDNFSDVIIGAPFESGGGAFYVITGTTTLSNMVSDPNFAWRVSLGNGNGKLGHSVASAGDVDKDGYADVIVGAPQQINGVNGGQVFVYRGSPTGITESWDVFATVANAQLGNSVGTAGDVNNDGYADVIVGAPGMTSPGGPGQAFSFYGSGDIDSLKAYNDSPTNLGKSTKLWTDGVWAGEPSFLWDFGDGTVAAGEKVDHTYATPGYFTAIVTATSFTEEITATTAVTISKSSFVDPSNGGTVEFLNKETGFGTKMEIPPGAVSDVLKISYTPLTTITQPSPTNSLGYYFDMDSGTPDYQLFLPLMMNGSGSNAAQNIETAVADVSLGTEATDSIIFAKPVTVTIVYNDAGLTLAEERSLKLPYWNKEQQKWIDIAAECNLEDTYVYYPDDNYFTVQVCHLSRFAVSH